MKKSEINISVTLDNDNFPEDIRWEATGSGMEGLKAAKSLMISLWDSTDPGTLRIDLWTKKMMIEEMQRFFYETFSSMAETYERATQEKETAATIRQFAEQFGKATNVLKPKP